MCKQQSRIINCFKFHYVLTDYIMYNIIQYIYMYNIILIHFFIKYI